MLWRAIVTKVSQDLICIEMLNAGTKPHAGLVRLQLRPSREETSRGGIGKGAEEGGASREGSKAEAHMGTMQSQQAP